MGAQRAPAPVLTGSVPPLADFYYVRQETGFGLATSLRPGETTLLLPAPPGSSGTGKTQLAVWFTHALWSARAVDLLAWIPAGSRTAVIAGYAQAATDLGLPGLGLRDGTAAADSTADDDARRFLDWLSRTERRWAVVLDDVSAADDIRGLWPRGPAGQVVVTSQLREAELAAPVSDTSLIVRAVPGFSRREALSYLNTRLTGFPDQRAEALDLAEDLSGQPIALALAAAVITATGISGQQYRAEYARRLDSVPAAVPGAPRPLLAAWSLAVEQAHRMPPAGLGWPALALAAALGPGGIPAAVVTAPAACAYILGLQHDADEAEGGSAAGSDEADLVRAAYGNLERLGLVTIEAGNAARTVWLHPAIRAATRGYLAPETIDQVTAAAATALLQAWPDAGAGGGNPPLSQALRDCAAALREFAGERLWQLDAHPVLLRAGASLTEPPVLAESAAAYWQELTTARCQRANAYYQADQGADGTELLNRTLRDCERYLGPDHPMTGTVRENRQAATE
jgi:hypothetical protein